MQQHPDSVSAQFFVPNGKSSTQRQAYNHAKMLLRNKDIASAWSFLGRGFNNGTLTLNDLPQEMVAQHFKNKTDAGIRAYCFGQAAFLEPDIKDHLLGLGHAFTMRAKLKDLPERFLPRIKRNRGGSGEESWFVIAKNFFEKAGSDAAVQWLCDKFAGINCQDTGRAQHYRPTENSSRNEPQEKRKNVNRPLTILPENVNRNNSSSTTRIEQEPARLFSCVSIVKKETQVPEKAKLKEWLKVNIIIIRGLKLPRAQKIKHLNATHNCPMLADNLLKCVLSGKMATQASDVRPSNLADHTAILTTVSVPIKKEKNRTSSAKPPTANIITRSLVENPNVVAGQHPINVTQRLQENNKSEFEVVTKEIQINLDQMPYQKNEVNYKNIAATLTSLASGCESGMVAGYLDLGRPGFNLLGLNSPQLAALK